MAPQIFAAEVSHQDAPLHIRERLLVTEALVHEQLGRLASCVDELFVLSTCNRFTVYALNDRITPLIEFFASFPALKGYVQLYHSSDEAVTHLFAVASGLLSRIKGDSCVIDQVTEAYHAARERNSIGITMDCFLREALHVARTVRTESGLDKFCPSVVDTGLAAVAKKVGDLRKKKILVVGTGKVARLALKYLYSEGARNICVVSQDIRRAEELAELYSVTAAELHKLHRYVREADVIVGGTHCEVTLFNDSFLNATEEGSKRWYILDFGMPRNFDWKLSEHPSIELYNLDDLKGMCPSPLDDFGGLEIAWKVVMQESRAFLDVLNQLRHSPVLLAYWKRLADVRHARKYLDLPRLENLAEKDIEQIRMHAKRLIHGSDKYLAGANALCNNLKPDNGFEIVRRTSFEKMPMNLSIN